MESFSTVINSRVFDGKGRNVSYEVFMNEVDGKFYSAVQQTRDSKRFGVTPRCKEFETFEQSKAYAYTTAKERLAKLMSNKMWFADNSAEIR
jgi:hypothetical protein